MHGGGVCLLLSVFCVFVVQTGAQWQGNYETVLVRGEQLRSYCICWYGWWGCSAWRNYWEPYSYYVTRCRAGWTDENGDRNCNKPVCNPTCDNGGKCIRPNVCECPSTAQGPYCRTLTCSYLLPCYPGECNYGSSCTCSSGLTSNKTADGCINFQESENRLRPVIGGSNVTIKHIRRADSSTIYMFVLEVSDVNSSIVWSNQQIFNFLKFEMRALFDGLKNLPDRPAYVHDTKMGIVENIITANVSKIPRTGTRRDYGHYKEYPCQEGYSRDNPYVETALCIINDDQFVTLIEHGDWLTVQFKSTSGGFQKLVNLDNQGSLHAMKYYSGLSVIKTVEFRFDFDAPKHCSEVDVTRCPSGSTILTIDATYTKGPIKPRWLGWTDIMSGVGEYYVEVFKLGPNTDLRLVETTPINPVFSATVPHTTGTIQYPEYTPSEPGTYSVLVEVRDNANNSRTARRFVLYDPTSSISLNNETAKLYVSSAREETGYEWQVPALTGTYVTVSVAWPNYFVNHLHEDNHYLAEIEQYPVQFKEIQADGVLSSQKYVNDSLDDNEEPRIRSAIRNFHGIVKYEINFVSTIDATEPTSGWQPIPLKESYTTQRPLVDGDRLRVWVRATDLMGNRRADSTIIKVDGSKPRLQTNTSKPELNIANGPYNYSSKVVFSAYDGESGVHKIGFDIFVGTDPNKLSTMKRVYANFTSGNIGSRGNAECRDVGDVCFLTSQTVFLDNCWMMVGKSELDKVVAMVNLTAYNQAMLGTSATINLGPVNKLQGLEKYDGPQNPRIVNKTPTGFRITWDLPEKQSCYGRAEIVIILSKKTATGADVLQTYYTPGTSNHFDILGLTPETEYTLGLNIQTAGTPAQQTDFLTTKTVAYGLLGVCDANTGPAGSLECVAFKDYNYKYQWSTCLSDAYIMRKSGGTHQCLDRTAMYCHYQCMLESHELETGPVYYDCTCDPNSPLKFPLPVNCYSPDGTDCSWYTKCLEAKYPCKEYGSSYAIGFGDKFCALYNKHFNKIDATSRLWIDAVRRCLQVALVPLIRQYTSVNCSAIKRIAYESHSGCYTNPYPGAPSICSLGAKNLFQVFVTVKSAFVDDFFATGDQLLETALKCGGLYPENTIQVVMSGVYTNTDYIDNVYNKLMKGLRIYIKNKLTSLADDMFIAPFIPNTSRNRRSTGETNVNVNVIFLPRAEYDLNYIGNPDVNVSAAVDRVMEAIGNGEIYLGLPTRSVSRCTDTGCTNATRTVIPPPPRASAALETLTSLTVLLTGVLLSQYAGP